MREQVHVSLPSRHSNPFATCWTRPGALAFQFAAGENAEQLVARLEAAGGHGAIIGPHGSGKSTLVATLKPYLAAAGWHVAAVSLRDSERRLPRGFVQRACSQPRPLVIIDGYEQLSHNSRFLLQWRCWWARAGLLVTSHRPVGLPLIHRTQVTRDLALQLVSTLTTHISSPIAPNDVAASLASCGSNFRELFFALYARHEALAGARRAAARTVTAAAT